MTPPTHEGVWTELLRNPPEPSTAHIAPAGCRTVYDKEGSEFTMVLPNAYIKLSLFPETPVSGVEATVRRCRGSGKRP
jgi:hypothetical protein